MKKQYYLWQTALLVAGLFAGGCTDEEKAGVLSGVPGEAIQFSVNASQSRTIYEPEEGDDYAQIDWVDGDEIGIYCEQAVLRKKEGLDQHALDGHSARYTVQVPTEHDYHGTIAPNGPMLTWGVDNNGVDLVHTFYGAYPYERIVWDTSNPASEGIFCMEYVTNQKCTINESAEGFGRIENYVAHPDMKNAYMMARKQMQRTQDHVLLDFDPIMTTLDITIEAGGYEVATGIIQPLTITGVSVLMPNYLVNGEFRYYVQNISNSDNGAQNFGKLASGSYGRGTESVHIQFVNESKNKVNIPLSEGETINLMAFLPPIPTDDTYGTKIKIHTAENFNFVATLNGKLGAQHKIHIKLPDIGPDAKTNSNWITDLGDNVKLTSMSIPGYVCSKNTTGAEITKLLDMGVRAFDMDELTFLKSGHQNISDAYHTVFKDFLNSHTGEFIILWTEENLTEDLTENKTSWTNWVLTIKDARSKVIAIRKYKTISMAWDNNCFIPLDKTYPGYDNSDKLFDLTEPSSIDDFYYKSMDAEWGVQFINDSKLKNKIYDEIVTNTIDVQRGYTGIVTIPNINLSDDNGAFTDDEKLIQAIIDCNYKFILDRNLNQP